MGGCCFWFATVAVVAVAPACSSLSGLTPPFPDWCAALERWPLLHRHLYRVVGCDPASGSAAAARLPECGASLESWKAAAVGVATVGGRRVAGLPAAQAAGYASLANGSFRCLDGQGAVPAAAVNDDFCDCADGSDEPGTSACAHLPRRCFYCPNEGAAPRVIYASRVGDGICDCCDGSDEAAGGPRAPCPDTCEEEGAAAREERARREADAVAGLRFLAESRAGAGERVAAWRREAAEIAATLPQLEQAEKDAKQRRDDLQKEVDAHRAAAEAARKAEAEAARRAEAEAEVEAARPAEAEAAAEAAAPAGPAAGAPPAAEAEAAPAEPAAGAAAAPRGGGAAGEAPVVSEYAKWALDRESKDAPDRGPASDSDADGPSTGTAGTGEDASTPQAERDLEDAKSAYLAASAKAKQARADKQELDKNAKLDFGDDFRWISLVGACPEKPLGEYTYKVCFFGEARQDRTLLGRYAGWDASDPMVMTFAKGSSCPGGTLRALRVRLECAASQELLSVTEPDRCSYEARLGHPAACTQEGLGLLQAPAGSSVRMPRDEL